MIIYSKLYSSRLRHQYGIFCGELQTSITRNATRARSEEGRLFSQARMSPGEFNYADNWNFAKFTADLFLSWTHQKKIPKPFSTQFNHSKEIWIFEIRSVFAELQLFPLEPLTRVEVDHTREFNYADNWNFTRIYCSFSIIGASGILAQSFSSQSKLSNIIRNFEFLKSVQYFVRNFVFTL